MLKQALMPYAAKAISSPTTRNVKRCLQEIKGRVRNEPHKVIVFIRADDPYSYLLLQVMGDFRSEFNIDIQYRTVMTLNQDMYPDESLWHQNAINDACRLAELYGLDFRKHAALPAEELARTAASILLHHESENGFEETALDVLRALWNDGKDTLANSAADTPAFSDVATQEKLKHNERVLTELGHYFGAMLYYRGEWYWGLDRLHYLEQRLIELDLAVSADAAPKFTKTLDGRLSLGARRGTEQSTKTLEIYFSIRSPYSYLGLHRAVELARYYGVKIVVKPVLPMVMRGMKVPEAKKMYIFLDTKREAEKYNLPYGFVADPLGAGVERCYALFRYAEEEGREIPYLLEYSRAVNSEGIHSHTDRGLRRIVERAGLNWEKAKPLLNGESWRIWAQANLDEMIAMGHWGVPSFRYGDVCCWGQDRLWLIERAVVADKAKPHW